MNLSSNQLFNEYLMRANYGKYYKNRIKITYRDKYKKFGKYQFNTTKGDFTKYEKHFELNNNFNSNLYKEIFTSEGSYIIYASDIIVRYCYNHDHNYQYIRNKYKEKYGSDDLFNDEMYYEVNLNIVSKFISNDKQELESFVFACNPSRRFKVFKLIYKNIFGNAEEVFNECLREAMINKTIVEKEFNLLDLLKR